MARVKEEKGVLKVRVLMNENSSSTLKGFHLAERKLKHYQIRGKRALPGGRLIYNGVM